MFTTSEILSLNAEAHPDYMEIEVGIISNQRNLNKTKFTNEFIANYGETIIGMPIQVDKENLEKGNYESLTHKYKNGELLTETIGHFESVYTMNLEEEDASILVGKARVYKRYSKTCEAIEELHGDEALAVSVEAMLTDYKEVDEGTDAYGGRMIGAAIVSNPAEVRATSLLLVAEALCEDLAEGGNDLDEKPIVAEMSMEDKMMALNEAFYEKEMGYWIVQTFEDMFIYVSEEDKKWKYYGMSYMMDEEGNVEFDMESKKEYVAAFVPVDEMSESFVQAEETIAEAKEEIKSLNEKIEELEKIDSEALQGKIDELAEKVVSLNDKIESLEEEKSELKVKAEELDEIKEKEALEQAEVEKERLSKMASRFFEKDEEGNFEESIANVIAEMDEKALKLLIADKVTIEIAEVVEDDDEEEEFVISSADDKVKVDPMKDFIEVKI